MQGNPQILKTKGEIYMLITIKTTHSARTEAGARIQLVDDINNFLKQHPNENWRTVDMYFSKKFLRNKIDAYSPIGECISVYSYNGYATLEEIK